MMTDRFNVWIRKKMDELQRNALCAHEGTFHSGKIQFAHIEETELRGMGRGRKQRYYDIIKNPDKYVPLCEYHHRIFDS